MYKKILYAALLFGLGILAAKLMPQFTPSRLIAQLSVVCGSLLGAYRIVTAGSSGRHSLERPPALALGFFFAAASAALVTAAVVGLTDASYSPNYWSAALAWHALAIAMCASTLEEIIFRGTLLVALRRRSLRSPVTAVLIVLQAGLFTGLHYSQFRLPIFYAAAFFLGVLLGIIVVLQRSLWLAIGLHAGLDFISAIVNGVHFRRAAELPGIFSFDAQGNIWKLWSSLIFPVAGLCWIAWCRRDRMRPREIA